MKTSLVVLVAFFAIAASQSNLPSDGADPLLLLQITDPHWDWEYVEGSDPSLACHSGKGNAGHFGHMHCQTPLVTINSSYAAAQQAVGNNAFALAYTGDWSKSGNTRNKVTPEELLAKLSEMAGGVAEYFPNTCVLPVLGNHDYLPEDQSPPVDGWLYKGLAQEHAWGRWIPEEGMASFLHGGFFTRDVGNVRFIVLNSCLWALEDKLSANDTDDEAHQLAWLEKQLALAQKEGLRVWILGHCFPGAELWPLLNERYLQAVSKYHSIISGSLFGHLHGDMYGMVMDDGGKGKDSVGTVWVGPSVSPDNGPFSHFPAFRVYELDRVSALPLDFVDYVLNLTESDQKAVWKRLYAASDMYPTPLTPPHLLAMYDSLVADNGGSVWQTWWSHFHSGWDSRECDAACRQLVLCSIRYLDLLQMSECMLQPFSHNQYWDAALQGAHIEEGTIAKSGNGEQNRFADTAASLWRTKVKGT